MATSEAASTDPVMIEDPGVADDVPPMEACEQHLKDKATTREEPRFPCVRDPNTIAFLRRHGRVFFITRGPHWCGKSDLVCKLHDLYPDSVSYWADKIFRPPDAPVRTASAVAKSHDLCKETIEHYMKRGVPVIVNKDNNLNVWETSPYLQLSATYGYTTILLDMNRYAPFDPEALTTANMRPRDKSYMLQQLKKWEPVHPFATGWAPKPQDAARLLRRYEQLICEIDPANSSAELKPVQNAQVYPFIPARICKFGWDETDRKYCCSELVREAYGNVDKIAVLGYALLGKTVVAVVRLTDVQVALRTIQEGAGENAVSQLAPRIEPRNATHKFFDEMRCTLNLRTIPVQEDPRNLEMSFEAGTPAFRELPPASHLSFIVLGVTSSSPFTYSKVVYDAARCLSSNVGLWKSMLAPASRVHADGVKIYRALGDRCCLIVDKQEVELDALFTGYYLSHTTEHSRSCNRRSAWNQRPPRRRASTPRNNAQSVQLNRSQDST